VGKNKNEQQLATKKRNKNLNPRKRMRERKRERLSSRILLVYCFIEYISELDCRALCDEKSRKKTRKSKQKN